MPEFNDLREQLRQTRDEKQQARQSLFKARERLEQLKAAQSELDRAFNPNNPEHLARRRRLDELLSEAQAGVKEHGAAFERFKESEFGRFKEFAALADPRKQIEHFNDRFPFLLLPVRIETRFKTVTQGKQLWVRIYPDECAVDTFEQTLSEIEVQSARNYQINLWRAGGIEAQERAAWRSLVASHGSGRAAWIARQYLALNANEKPKKAKDADVILVIPTEQPLAGQEKDAAVVFWPEFWRADGDKNKEEAAFDTLQRTLDPDRATTILNDYKPINLGEQPSGNLKKTDVAVQAAILVFPESDATETKRQAWSQAARVNVLPDRFILIGYTGEDVAFEAMGNPIPSPLIAGPDPSAKPADQLRQKDGEIITPEEMRWMVDFERAVEVGMGFKITLSDAQARAGFSRLLALGIRLSADERKSQALIEELFQHHQNGRGGFSLLPQGTPTNNTEEKGAGFSSSDDADASFDDNFNSKPEDLFVAPENWAAKKDGQWLAEYLGIESSLLQTVRHAGGTDQCEARAMNAALWPATLGYLMETMMHPVLGAGAVEEARWFFNHFVRGRGAIPAVRIGAQPYGILPTTAFSRMRWHLSDRLPATPGLEHPSNYRAFLRQLDELLKTVDADWGNLAKNVSFVGRAPVANRDAHQILLDIVGLHAGSVEYHQRYAESLSHLFNLFNLGGLGGTFLAALIAAGYVQSGKDLLRKLGYTGEATPDILNRFFLSAQHLLKGPIVDDRPLSETEAIRKYTDEADESKRRNYIQWLIDAAKTSLETIRQEKGFLDNQSPTALLYLMLRHALVQGYWDTSLRLHDAAQIPFSSAIRREPEFIHVRQQAEASESRWERLYKTDARITNNPAQLIADYIPRIIGKLPAARNLDEQLAALEHLKDAPTARLERAFAEHIDCCSYRFDAWRLGMLHYQLAAMRYTRSDNGVAAQKGLYLGAYGWLEELRPENKPLTTVELDTELNNIFNKPGDPPLERDATNGGYIHAPSLNHAVTAAVLRNGYLANATPANPQTLAVNLSSERVRMALSILEGIRGGQSLGALLGYQFERGMHDRHNQAEVDQFIYRMRKAFPLRANQLTPTKTDDGVSIEAIEARNVMDGVKLVEHIRKTANQTYPFGVALLQQPPTPSAGQSAAIAAEVDRLLDIHDAVADLALAEGVHQAVQGNYDRVASTLDAYSKGNFPPEPDVVQTPRSGVALTHRIGLHLQAGLAPAGTPRAKAEPALNQWLGAVLPPPAGVFCKVEIAASPPRDVTLDDLQLQPIDLLYLVRTESEPAMGELDDRILRHVINTFAPRPDAEIKIKYLERPAGKISIFELAPLMESLRSLVLRSRPLRASDIALQTESRQEQDEAVSVDRQRIVAVRNAMQSLHAGLTAFNAAAANLDDAINQIVALLAEAGTFGIPQTGWGFAYDWKRQAFIRVLQQTDALVNRWNDRLTDYNALLAKLPTATTNEEKFALLQQAERLISTKPETPLPATPAAFELILDARKTAFINRLNDFKAFETTGIQSINGLINAVTALLPVDDFDVVGFDLAESEKQVVSFAAELNERAKSLAADVDRRLNASQAQLDAHEASARASERVSALETAARILLGDEFKLIPEFDLSTDQGAEWEKALNASNDLLKHLTDAPKSVDFPVDDWLYGVARVREKMRHWEKSLMLTEGFGSADLNLTPIQLPHKAGDRWLGLEFPEDETLTGDRLLYTAHYAAPFQKSQRQCGLLLDEWTEVIPGATETTGIAIHYDRPNSEPPQVMLLVTPPDFDGAWKWADLVDALNETLELAKKRAVEPVHVDATAYARFLPATVMAATLYQISISANLALNNNALALIEQRNNG